MGCLELPQCFELSVVDKNSMRICTTENIKTETYMYIL